MLLDSLIYVPVWLALAASFAVLTPHAALNAIAGLGRQPAGEPYLAGITHRKLAKQADLKPVTVSHLPQ